MGRLLTWKATVPTALLLAALLSLLVVWAWNAGATGGLTDSTGIKGMISYEVRDAAGNLKFSNTIHNAINKDPMETVATNRLVTLTTTMADDTAVFARIVAIDVPQGGDVAGTSDDATNGWLATQQTLLLDGGAAAGNQNPADGTNPVYNQVRVTFTAGGAAVIRQLGLVKTAADNTLVGGGVAIPTGDLLAHQDVNITLANLDTLQVTWSRTVTGTGD